MEQVGSVAPRRRAADWEGRVRYRPAVVRLQMPVERVYKRTSFCNVCNLLQKMLCWGYITPTSPLCMTLWSVYIVSV